MTENKMLIRGLPDIEAAERFLQQFTERHAKAAARLGQNDLLRLDVLTLASFSPLLASTMLQNPEYIVWLGRNRSSSILRSKEEMLESLARFSLTSSQIDTHIQLARFRRRELMRIFLQDIRGLATIAEITNEISNLADAILEHALRIARQELNNRYGFPLATDQKGRSKPVDFCIVSLGKLGSRELNYASDIDLLFIFSDEGTTAGGGSRSPVSNREYFAKLAEAVVELVGRQKGEGAAFRVDLRLRPHGRVGPLAMSLTEISRYYQEKAAMWERQVLIRCRTSAGDESLFKRFYSAVESSVFSPDEKIEEALENVRRSKQKIDSELIGRGGYDVKLGRGGIREIEFIAQALQLAHGGRDKWLRAPHTLISLRRLADRQLIAECDLTDLYEGYEFFRRVEHRLQMENGLQTHTVPDDPGRRQVLARRMGFTSVKDFNSALKRHADRVSDIFSRVFGPKAASGKAPANHPSDKRPPPRTLYEEHPKKRGATADQSTGSRVANKSFARVREVSWRAAEMAAADPELAKTISAAPIGDYHLFLLNAVRSADDFGQRLAALRQRWSQAILKIIAADVNHELALAEVKNRQTQLSEASIAAALFIAVKELERKFGIEIDELPIAILGLGKLGGGAMDYDSDLDIVIAYDDVDEPPFRNSALHKWGSVTSGEFYARAVEIFVNTLSALTRYGSLYRVDLRLRPFGKDGAMAIERQAFIEYMKNRAAIWELMAYVKLRGVGGKFAFAREVEYEIRGIVHDRARKVTPDLLSSETLAVRNRLERQMAPKSGHGEIDIKFGVGGMLDVYFATRFLQLRDDVRDDEIDRTTAHTLSQLRDRGSLLKPQYDVFLDAYRFLSRLDHVLRLTVGRRARIRPSDNVTTEKLAEFLGFDSAQTFLDALETHRTDIRRVFNAIVGSK